MKNNHIHISAASQSGTGFDRREFIKLSGILASGLLVSPMAFGKSHSYTQETDWPLASQNYITPVFILDAMTRLGIGSGFIQAGIKHCITPDITFIVPGNAFRLGALVPYGKKEILQALDKIKLTWGTGVQDQKTAQKLGLLAGALCYQSSMDALDKANKFTELSPSGNPENKIYQDAAVIRSYLTKGKPMAKKEQSDLKSLFREMVPRTFIRFHTVMPDDADGAGWVMKTAHWRKQSDLYFGELSRAIAQPDDAKVKKYLMDTDFMDGNDLMVKKISPFAKISDMNIKDARSLVNSTEEGSVLAKALAAGFNTLIDLNDFMAGGISLDKWISKI